MKKIFILLIALQFMGCFALDKGYVTLVNSDTEKLSIFIDKRSFDIFPANHITKKISVGPHEIKINGKPPVNVDVRKNMTLLFDSSGLSCFAVADFEQLFRGGNPMIIERSKHSQVFEPDTEITVMLGAPLPKKLESGVKLTRIHQVDCEIIDDDLALLKEISSH